MQQKTSHRSHWGSEQHEQVLPPPAAAGSPLWAAGGVVVWVRETEQEPGSAPAQASSPTLHNNLGPAAPSPAAPGSVQRMQVSHMSKWNIKKYLCVLLHLNENHLKAAGLSGDGLAQPADRIWLLTSTQHVMLSDGWEKRLAQHFLLNLKHTLLYQVIITYVQMSAHQNHRGDRGECLWRPKREKNEAY